MIFPPILAAGCLLLAQPAPGLVRGPYLQSLLATSVEIAWRTEEVSLGAVRVRPAEGPGEPRAEATFTEAAPGTEHRVQVTGLAPGTVHEYVVLDADRVLAEGFRFRTAPPTGEGELHAVVAGDSGWAQGAQYAVAALLRKLEPDLFLHTGDYDYAGDLDRSVFYPECGPAEDPAGAWCREEACRG
ncbi:MAG TPA: fibronectin type III domain-containing protein [Planctomycetota bacterium]|nr:fibronectin type III domain-containing protein [Planctomycetota bacterium]